MARGNGNGNGDQKGLFQNKLGKGITRRDFFKISAAGAAAGNIVNWSLVEPVPGLAAATDRTVRTLCPYCSVGCGMRAAVDASDNVLDVYGDSDHAISEGGLCSKGSAAIKLIDNSQRVTEPRIKYNGEWYKHGTDADSGWSDILADSGSINLANWRKLSDNSVGSGTIDPLPVAMAAARDDATWGPESVAFLGSSHMTNEECYLYRKLIAVFGTNNTEHQARI